MRTHEYPRYDRLRQLFTRVVESVQPNKRVFKWKRQLYNDRISMLHALSEVSDLIKDSEEQPGKNSMGSLDLDSSEIECQKSFIKEDRTQHEKKRSISHQMRQLTAKDSTNRQIFNLKDS